MHGGESASEREQGHVDVVAGGGRERERGRVGSLAITRRGKRVDEQPRWAWHRRAVWGMCARASVAAAASDGEWSRQRSSGMRRGEKGKKQEDKARHAWDTLCQALSLLH
jgi:hypothetical protein